jgi:hypothetical protein
MSSEIKLEETYMRLNRLVKALRMTGCTGNDVEIVCKDGQVCWKVTVKFLDDLLNLRSATKYIDVRINPRLTETEIVKFMHEVEEDAEKSIAPHEGSELALVLEGKKLICTIHKKKQPEQFNTALRRAAEDLRVSVGKLHGDALIAEKINDDETAFYLRENHDVAAVHRLLLRRPDVLVRSQEERSRLFGRIFGYTEEQIDEFIAAEMPCACGHCKWDQ